MEEYIARRGYGLITDREIRVALGKKTVYKNLNKVA